MPRRTLHNKTAMTLIEVLLVISIISIMSVAIYSSLTTGIKVWQRSQKTVVEQDIVLFFEKITEDLRNSFQYSLIAFDGTEENISFPAMIRTEADPSSAFPKGEYIDQIGKIEYKFDYNNDRIIRREANYSEAIEGIKYGKEQDVLTSVKKVKFRYIYYTDEGEFISATVLETPPSALEIEVGFSDLKGMRIMRKFIEVPIGY